MYVHSDKSHSDKKNTFSSAKTYESRLLLI